MALAHLLRRTDTAQRRRRVPRSQVAHMGLAKGGAFY